MTTKLRSRPSHYEVLGLTPSATPDEISAAFAGKMSLFRARPLSDLAQVTAAYETLRNPSKRREYDRSLEPKREPERLEWSFRAAQQSWTPFIGSIRVPDEVRSNREQPFEPHVTVEPNPDPDPRPSPAPQPRPAPDPRIESISASLRELAKPVAATEPSSVVAQPQAERPGAPVPFDPRADRPIRQRPEVSLDQLVDQIRTAGRAEKDRLRGGPRLPLDWKQPIWAAGGLVLGVGTLGGIAGIAAGGDVHDSVTVAIPAAKPVSKMAEPSAELASSLVQAPEQRARPQVATARIEPSRSFERPAVLDNAPTQVAVADASSEGQTDPGDPLAPIPAAAPATAASLPLSNAVIARTIDRIGYPCGEVASAAPADDQGQGVFKITCSSGHTYQAAPVHGRYRFRRWDRR